MHQQKGFRKTMWETGEPWIIPELEFMKFMCMDKCRCAVYHRCKFEVGPVDAHMIHDMNLMIAPKYINNSQPGERLIPFFHQKPMASPIPKPWNLDLDLLSCFFGHRLVSSNDEMPPQISLHHKLEYQLGIFSLVWIIHVGRKKKQLHSNLTKKSWVDDTII